MPTSLPIPPKYFLRPHELSADELAALTGRVILLAPHPDDEAIGCGGLMAWLAAAGAKLEVVFLTAGADTPANQGAAPSRRMVCAGKALKSLGISRSRVLCGLNGRIWPADPDLIADLAMALREELPELILLPHPGERHADHRGASPCLAAALAKMSLYSSTLPRILFYEVWTPLPQCNRFLDISLHLAAKRAAMDCYDADIIGNLKDAIIGLNRYRAVSLMNRNGHAEVFAEVDFDDFMELAAEIRF